MTWIVRDLPAGRVRVGDYVCEPGTPGAPELGAHEDVDALSLVVSVEAENGTARIGVRPEAGSDERFRLSVAKDELVRVAREA